MERVRRGSHSQSHSTRPQRASLMASGQGPSRMALSEPEASRRASSSGSAPKGLAHGLRPGAESNGPERARGESKGQFLRLGPKGPRSWPPARGRVEWP